jgi:hypothetical protein
VAAPHACLGCRSKAVQPLVDFGPQPPSNRFEPPEFPNTEVHPLIVGQCTSCGLVQLVNPMPPQMARSRFEWLTYNEPEGHLDDLVSRLRQLPGVASDSRIIGLTYKDDSLLARFNRLRYSNTYRIDPVADLSLQDRCAGLESIQGALDRQAALRLATQYGLADVLLVRHILEHAHDPAEFVRALSALVKPGGYIVFEMPDCTKFVKACDYSFVWEEHITYFCAPTLDAFIAKSRLGMREVIVYPYPLEDSLIGIVTNEAQTDAGTRTQAELESLLAHGRTFAGRYPERHARLQSLFGAWRKAGKRVAIFGAGHLAAKFTNMFALGKLVDCVIDDNTHKQDLLMPGSRLAIRGSAALESRAIDLCLLSLNPESEHKVLAKNQPFLERGGQFLSIFAASPRAVYDAGAA